MQKSLVKQGFFAFAGVQKVTCVTFVRTRIRGREHASSVARQARDRGLVPSRTKKRYTKMRCKNWVQYFYISFLVQDTHLLARRFFRGSRLRVEMKKAKLFKASRSGDRVFVPPFPNNMNKKLAV
jgi:hypothetical protein